MEANPNSTPREVDDQVTGAALLARLYASPSAHRLVPARLALALAASVGPALRQRRNPAERRDAERFMTDLLLHTARAGEAQKLARQWMAEKARIGELFWRPWLLMNSRILGRENLEAARVSQRGRIFVFGHIGATWATVAVLGRAGLLRHAVVGPHYFAPLPAGYVGLSLRHRHWEYGEKVFGPSGLIPSDAPPEQLVELLEAGESLGIAFDVGGFSTVPFLGRSITLSGGIGTLAFATQAVVIPVVPERRGARIDIRVLGAIDPLDYANSQSVRVAIARVFEPVVLQRPQSVELAWNPSPLVTEAPPSVWEARAPTV